MQQKTREELVEKNASLQTLPEDLQMNLSDFALFLTVIKVKKHTRRLIVEEYAHENDRN